jgi:GNAT superfamily N-acetyltransferase
MTFTFAIASESDAAAIATLRTAAATHLTKKFGQGHWSSAATERGVLRDLSRPKFARTIIARHGREIIGTLHLQTKKPWAIDTAYFTAVAQALYLINMAVLPARQGQGVGRQLLAEAICATKEWPAQALRLDAWNAPAGAGAFYSKCGFREVGRVVYREAPLVYYELLL